MYRICNTTGMRTFLHKHAEYCRPMRYGPQKYKNVPYSVVVAVPVLCKEIRS